jgi:hypothetical protein
MLPRDDTELAESWLDGALARFAADNDDLVLQTRSLLARIVADAPRHARLANTLSMLEHLGSHKIMKRQAEKTAQRPLEYIDDDLLAPASARMYFQRLEAALKRRLAQQRSARAIYLYMSMIVEFRALWFYGLYQQALQRARDTFSLKRVLGEEQSHLGDVANRLEIAGELSDARTVEFVGYEKALFARLLAAMQRAVT